MQFYNIIIHTVATVAIPGQLYTCIETKHTCSCRCSILRLNREMGYYGGSLVLSSSITFGSGIEPVWLAACNIMMTEVIKGSKQL